MSIINNELIQQAVYHYAGNNWTMDFLHDDYINLFFQYFVCTPWSDGKFWRVALGKLEQIRQNEQRKIWQIAAGWSGKARTFIIHREDEAWIREQIAIRDDDLVAYVDNGSLQLEQKHYSGRILIICHVFYQEIAELLKGFGLKQNIDFVDGRIFIGNHYDSNRTYIEKSFYNNYRVDNYLKLRTLKRIAIPYR